MTAALKRVRLVPYDKAGTELQVAEAIRFDFNPETLSLKVSSGQQQDKARGGRKQVQNVGASSATLSFEAIFDTTRPKAGDIVEDGNRNDDRALDVRKRTKPIADLMATVAQPGGGTGSGQDSEKAPRRVQFQWGTILFDGIITSHQETFDFFAPNGVPLRSKVALTLTEQDFRYAVNANDLARSASAAGAAPANVRAAGASSNADSLFDLGSGGLKLGFSASLDVGLKLEAGFKLQAELGFSASFDAGISLGAGISLDASAAIEVFGPAALPVGGASSGRGGGDAGQAGLSRLLPSPGKPAPGARPPPSPWAPDGPAAGSRAAGLAAMVNGMRASIGAAPGNARGAAAPAIAPVRGSPPPALPRAPRTDAAVYMAGSIVPVGSASGGRRPRWETLRTATAGMPPLASPGHRGGCGCRCCGGR